MTTLEGHRTIAARLEAEAARNLNPPDDGQQDAEVAQAFALLAISHRVAALDLNLAEEIV